MPVNVPVENDTPISKAQKYQKDFKMSSILTQNIKKMNGGPFEDIKFFSKKRLPTPKKLKGRTLWDFLTSILSQIMKKIEGGAYCTIFFEKKSHIAEKSVRGNPLVSSSFVCYAKKRTTLIVQQFSGPKGTIWRLEIFQNF